MVRNKILTKKKFASQVAWQLLKQPFLRNVLPQLWRQTLTNYLKIMKGKENITPCVNTDIAGWRILYLNADVNYSYYYNEESRII